MRQDHLTMIERKDSQILSYLSSSSQRFHLVNSLLFVRLPLFVRVHFVIINRLPARVFSEIRLRRHGVKFFPTNHCQNEISFITQIERANTILITIYLINRSLFLSTSPNTCSRIRSISSARSIASPCNDPEAYSLSNSFTNRVFISSSSKNPLLSISAEIERYIRQDIFYLVSTN